MYPKNNMYYRNNYIRQNPTYIRTNHNFNNPNDERFFGGGIVAPLLIGGIAGYALGRPNYPYFPQQQVIYNCCPPQYYPYPVYYN